MEAGVPVKCSETVRSHGWRSQAYREVFTACFRTLHRHLGL